jgi:hypothetical protein
MLRTALIISLLAAATIVPEASAQQSYPLLAVAADPCVPARTAVTRNIPTTS